MKFKRVCEKIILIIVMLSLLTSFVVAPSSYAKLTLKDGEFYYAGTTKGTYKASGGNIFSWLIDCLAKIAQWILNIITMGPRMVFVGWTALLERMLTWTLETTTGVNMKGDGVDSSTDLSSLSDSSSNITVEAIVYNKVPAFNINFFDFEYDPSVSGTGHTFTCDKCDKPSKECVTDSSSCGCECKGKCDDCKAYMAGLDIGANVDETPPVVIQLKSLVAEWYYVLRILSLIAMLLILIGIGIKMAISTIASEKALYKRMFFDWVAGLIILVSSHYMMWAIITINDTLVNVIKESANSINQVQLKQLYDKDDPKGEKKEITNEEIELSVYEEIRTRAYDPKLSVGLSGMIMYMTLVYFAIRYSLVYLKRFLTIVVLTLMGPPVGAAYALQKAMSGKSSTFKAWLTEYIMNVIIQTVHALIYAVFISAALVFSLKSVAGMIIALIFMNFALKAEKLFKQIFKMSSEGSLLESAEKAGDAENIRSNIKAATGMYMGAKPVTKALMNTPFAKAVKGVGKVGAVGIGLGAKGALAAKDAIFGKPDYASQPEENENPNNGNSSDQANIQTDETDGSSSAKIAIGDEAYSKTTKGSNIKSGVQKGEKTLRHDAAIAVSEYMNLPPNKRTEAATEKLNSAVGAYAKHKALGLPSMPQIVRGHIERATDMTNHFQFSPEKNTAIQLWNGTFGTGHYDVKSGKWVSDGNGYYKQLSASKLLGFTDEDKKMFKEHVRDPIKNSFLGMKAMFFGLGTMVAHPTMGMAMLAGGYAATRGIFKRPASAKKYKGTYSFSRFSTPTMNNIQKAAMSRANREIKAVLSNADGQMTERLKMEHPEFCDKLMSDIEKELKADRRADRYIKPLKNLTNIGLVGTTFGIASTGGIFSHIEAIQKHTANQTQKQQISFMEDGINFQAGLQQDRFAKGLESESEKYSKEALEKTASEMGYTYNSETDTITQNQEEKKAQEIFELAIIESYSAQGMIYDPKTGTLRPKDNSSERKNNYIAVSNDEISDNFKNATGQKISEVDIRTIDREIENIVEEMLSKSAKQEVDMTSEAVQNRAMTDLTNRLITAGILSPEEGKNKNQNQLFAVFKDGKAGVENAFKRRAEFSNTKAKTAATALKKLSSKEQEQVKTAVSNVLKENNGDYSKLTVSDIMQQMSEKKENAENLNTKSDTKGVPKADGSKTADRTKDGSSKVVLEKAVLDYIGNLQRSEVTGVTTTRSVDKKKSKINNIAKEKADRKKKKLQDILSLNLDETLSTEETVNKVSDVKKNNGGKIGDVEFTKDQASDIVELLLMRKEMETLNEFAVNELGISKGTKKYKQQLKAKSDATIDYYARSLDLEKEKQKSPYSDYSKDEIRRSLDQIDKDIESTKSDLSMSDKLKNTVTQALEEKRKQLNITDENQNKRKKAEEIIKSLTTTEELNETQKKELKDAEKTIESMPKISTLEEAVAKARIEKEKAEKSLPGAGPIIDIDDFISKSLNSKK